MDKFGVEEQVPETKTSEDKEISLCPQCKSILRDVSDTGILLCPNCGSKPFESR